MKVIVGPSKPTPVARQTIMATRAVCPEDMDTVRYYLQTLQTSIFQNCLLTERMLRSYKIVVSLSELLTAAPLKSRAAETTPVLNDVPILVSEVSMAKKRVVLLGVAVLLALTFTLGRKTFSKAVHQEAVHQDLPPNSASQQTSVVPDYVVYNSIFRKVVSLRNKTIELQSQGRIGQNRYFPLQRDAGLTESQASALEAIAFDCRKQVSHQDEKAKAIVNAFQSRFLGGRVPSGGSPPPPPELKAMWEERNAMILRARDQLRLALGAEQFTRFDNYAKFHYGANTAPISIDPLLLNSK